MTPDPDGEDRAKLVRQFFDHLEQDPRTPAELDAIRAEAWRYSRAGLPYDEGPCRGGDL